MEPETEPGGPAPEAALPPRGRRLPVVRSPDGLLTFVCPVCGRGSTVRDSGEFFCMCGTILDIQAAP